MLCRPDEELVLSGKASKHFVMQRPDGLLGWTSAVSHFPGSVPPLLPPVSSSPPFLGLQGQAFLMNMPQVGRLSCLPLLPGPLWGPGSHPSHEERNLNCRASKTKKKELTTVHVRAQSTWSGETEPGTHSQLLDEHMLVLLHRYED